MRQLAHGIRIIGIVIAGVVATAQDAPADPLRADQVLRIEFVAPAMPYPGYVPDVLVLDLGGRVTGPFVERAASLYDGDRLLGTYTSTVNGHIAGPLGPYGFNSYWTGAGSLFTFGDPAVVDFSTIADRTIAGRIDFSIAAGLFDVNFSETRLTIARSTHPSGYFWSNASGPRITSMSIVDEAPVPEPATWLLFASGCALAARARRRAATRRA